MPWAYLQYLSVGGDIVGVAALLAPGALDGVTAHLRVVRGHDGVGRGFFRGKSKLKRQ